MLLQILDTFPRFVVDFSLRALLLGLLAGAAALVTRGRNSPAEYTALRVLLVAMLLLPVATFVVPTVHVAIVLDRLAARSPWFPVLRQPMQTSKNAVKTASPVPASPTDRAHSDAQQLHWPAVVAIAYFVISGFLASRIVIASMLLRRILPKMEAVDDARLLEKLNHHCSVLGLSTFPQVRTTHSLSVPVTVGWRVPAILLPTDWESWSSEKLDAVLAHELSHIQRGDYLFRVLAALNKAFYWFHPLSWWLETRMVQLSEQISDDAVLAAGIARRESYAEILRAFAGTLARSHSRFRLGIPMSVPTSGSRRIDRILDPHRSLRPNLSLAHKAMICALAIPVVVLIAGAQTAARPSAPTASQTASTPTVLQAPPGRRIRVPQPLFSRDYIDALQGVLNLEGPDVEALENRLARNPEDFEARLKLLAYHKRADRETLPESRQKRWELVFWLVDHHPESEILGSPYGLLSPADLTADQLAQMNRVWSLAVTSSQSDARVFWHAAAFYRESDRASYVPALEKAVALAPENENYARDLGLLYAGAILNVDLQSAYRDAPGPDPAMAEHARQVLDSTPNPLLLEPAIHLLQNEYNASLMRGRENSALGGLASRYFARAKTLDPDLDQAWIFPKIDPAMVGMLAPGAQRSDIGAMQFESAAGQIRRLPSNAFSSLPASIRTFLEYRGCLIPQQTFSDPSGGQPHNVIQGEFFEPGKTVWAVLCSVNGSSSILVFRDALDRRPEELVSRNDKDDLQGAGEGRIAYSRAIEPVDRKFIVEHYRAYGGPEPPPIDHEGIDDQFVGKASTVHYWYRGEWKTLQGAD
jgi:beta-lactamase regulating signal transducer with metallopeptidase domain